MRCAIVVLASIAVAYPAETKTQQVDPVYEGLAPAAQLSRPVRGLQQGPQSVRAALVDVLRLAGLPGGIELGACPDATEPAVSLPSRTTVKAALDQIIGARPGLQVVWSTKNLINIRESGGAPLLDVTIPSFEISDAVDLRRAANLIVEDPAVRQQVEAMKLQETPARLGFSSIPRDNAAPQRAVSLQFHGGMLRGILNGLAAANGRGIWVYSESGCTGQRRFELVFPMQ